MDRDPDELVRAACMGDLEARGELGRRLFPKVHRFFAKSHNSRERRDDLLQNTMVDFWAKISARDPKTEAEFMRIAFGMAWMSRLNGRSRDAREHEHEAMLQLIPAPTPTRSPTSKIMQREIVERYLRELSTPIREAVMWKSEGGTLKEYADERGISLNTAHSRYRIGMDQLRERLARDNLTPGQFGL